MFIIIIIIIIIIHYHNYSNTNIVVDTPGHRSGCKPLKTRQDHTCPYAFWVGVVETINVLMLLSRSCGGQECPDDFFSMSQSHSQLPEDFFFCDIEASFLDLQRLMNSIIEAKINPASEFPSITKTIFRMSELEFGLDNPQCCLS